MVFGARAPNHTCLGLDVTLQCTMNADDVRDRFSAPLLDVVLPMAELWLAEHETLTFHDPLAAVSVFDPQVCEYESGRIDSPLSSNQRLQGRTMFSPDAAGPHAAPRRARVVDGAERRSDHIDGADKADARYE